MDPEVSPERGDGPAHVAQLLMRHRTSLLAYLLAALRNPHDAEDLLQDVALAATSSWAQYDPATPFLPWAREIARRRILDFAGKRVRRPALLDPEVLARLDVAAARLDAEAPQPRSEALRRCLEGLGGHVRQVLALRYDERLDVGDVARRAGRTTQATYAILKRAKELLRDCVARRLASEGG
jgi:RNA polymerase sigma-70 factor (ECF subfamily)